MSTAQGWRAPRWLQLSWRQWAVVVVVAAAAAVAALVIASRSSDTYSATSTVLFRSSGVDQTLFGVPAFSESGSPDRDAETNLRLIRSEGVAQRTITALGLQTTPQELLDHTDVGAQGNSNLADITYRAGTPDEAARVANTLADQFVASRREADQANIDAVITAARQRLDQLRTQGGGSEVAELTRRLNDLSLLAATQTGNAEVVDRAVPPTEADGPHAARTAGVAGVLALILALVVVAAWSGAARRGDAGR